MFTMSEKQWRIGGYGFIAMGTAVGLLYCVAYEQPILTLWSAIGVLFGTLLIILNGGASDQVGLIHIALGILIGVIASISVSVLFGIAWGLTGIIIGLYLVFLEQFAANDRHQKSL
jgi:hypothetical protein